jgi:hypothetical protein
MSLRALMIATPDQGCVGSVGGVLGGVGAVLGAGAGVALGSVPGLGACGAGLVLEGLAGAPGNAGNVGTVRLCFCASGMTSGPFWPQPTVPQKRTSSAKSCTNFMIASIRAPALPV